MPKTSPLPEAPGNQGKHHCKHLEFHYARIYSEIFPSRLRNADLLN